MPVTAAAISAGTQTLGGLAQTLFGGKSKRKALKEIEGAQDPTYAGSSAISDYYNKALQKYNQAYGVNPYESNQYKVANQKIGQNMAAGLGALQDRRSAISGVNKLVGIGNAASNQAGLAAEATARAERNASLGQLAGAASAKGSEDRYKFQTNQLMPFQRRMNLLQLKAGGAAANQQAGLNNIFNGISGLSSLAGGGASKGGGGASAVTGGSQLPDSYADYLKMTQMFGG